MIQGLHLHLEHQKKKMDNCLTTLSDMSHPVEGLGFGVGMSRFGSALEPPWSQKVRAKASFLRNNVLFGLRTGSSGLTIVEALPVRTP